MTFRAAYLQTVPVRVVDLACHAVLAVVLPGPWWWQYLPDVALPAVWVHSWRTDTFLGPSSRRLAAHRALHLRGEVGVAMLLVLAVPWAVWPGLGVHWLAHVLVDRCTHDGRWQ